MMMRIAPLLIAGSLLAGCFTAIGAGAGGTVAASGRKDHNPASGMVVGGLLGLALDVAIVSMIVSALPEPQREQSCLLCGAFGN